LSLGLGASKARAAEGAAGKALNDWVTHIDRLSAALKAGEASLTDWQDGVADILTKMPLNDIAAAIDFERLAATAEPAEKGVATARVRLPRIDPAARVVGAKLFIVGKGRAVIPHGHTGMASGHLVMKGAFHLRQYDRVAMEDGHWRLRQTVDRREAAGAISTISDDRDNVHWLIAEELSYTLDFIMAPARADEDWEIQNLDIEAATQDGGFLLAPTMDVGAALAKYG
jgi:hypothetical protein